MLGPLRRPARRALLLTAGLVAVALAILAGTVLPTASPHAGTAAAQAADGDQTSASPMFPLYGRKSNGHLYDYEPKGTGGFHSRVDLGGGYAEATALVQANVSDGGKGNDLYFRMDGNLYYTAERGNDTTLIGGGWNTYDLLVSVGDMGGSPQPDLLGRHDDDLFYYAGRPDGTLERRVQIGFGGWDTMDELVGRGDYTGDGVADLLARRTVEPGYSSSGTLYLYPGTGDAAAGNAFAPRIAVSTGWEEYGALACAGDNNGDGRTDLIAVAADGGLWLFPGTGDAGHPFGSRVRIGSSGWDNFNALF